MLLACLARRFPSKTDLPNGSADPETFPDKFQAVYIVSPHPFPEIDIFVASSGAEYNLEVARYVMPMKDGLEVYLAERPDVQAVFVGTRRTDPHGEKLHHFDPTDAGWPSFMRIHPVIDWHYGTFSRMVLKQHAVLQNITNVTIANYGVEQRRFGL